MACCELVNVNLTIIIIQRITHAFDCASDCAFDKSNVCGSHSNANAFTISRRHLTVHSNAQHSNAFAFVNKPDIFQECQIHVTDHTESSFSVHVVIVVGEVSTWLLL